MELLESYPLSKKVTVLGHELEIPVGANVVTIDKDGSIYAHNTIIHSPVVVGDYYWDRNYTDFSSLVGKAKVGTFGDFKKCIFDV